MKIRQRLREARELVRLVSGAVVAVVTLPMYINMVAKDFRDELRYENQPGFMEHNPEKPTPNTEDFPNGAPRLARSRRYSDWMIRTFVN